jgi:hypothetical protein
MRRAFVWAIFVLGAIFLNASVGMAQNAPAGAPGNPPPQGTGAAGNPPQQGGARASGPIAGPPHDPRDLTGIWNMRFGGGGFGRVQPKLTPFGEQLFKQAKSSNSGEYTLQETNDPVITKCFPPGVPRIYLQPFPWQIVQTPKETVFLYEYDHTVRHVFTDGRKHPEDVTPTYMGDSIGRWDGDTFVVDTVGFNEKTWLDRFGRGHSDQLHVIERFYRVNQNDLEADITMEDPKTLAEPWNVRLQFQFRPEWTLEEQVCADNGDFVTFEK